MGFFISGINGIPRDLNVMTHGTMDLEAMSWDLCSFFKKTWDKLGISWDFILTSWDKLEKLLDLFVFHWDFTVICPLVF